MLDIKIYIFTDLQQTNTADMLEEAVEYVKFLQKQIQVLLALNPLLVYLISKRIKVLGPLCYIFPVEQVNA